MTHDDAVEAGQEELDQAVEDWESEGGAESDSASSRLEDRGVEDCTTSTSTAQLLRPRPPAEG
jgi:hypothetical protein